MTRLSDRREREVAVRFLTRLTHHVQDMVPPGREGLVWWLTLLASVGVTSIIPLLPLYAADRGADLQVISGMAAAYLVTNLVVLYGAGRLSDWWGRRPMMTLGLVTYAGCSVGFMIWPTPLGFVLLRGIEGIGAACFLPAALAYVADRYPVAQRGLRISQLAIAENLGLLLGPAFGGALKTLLGMNALFVSLTVLCAAGAAMVWRLPGGRAAPTSVVPGEADGQPLKGDGPSEQPTEWAISSSEAIRGWGAVRWPLFAGISARAASAGFAFGLYLTVWPLFLRKMGASDWDVALSWTLFAVPALIIGSYAGRLIDRSGPGRPAVLGALFSGGVVISYAYVGDVRLVLALCMLEGVGFAFSYPAANTLMVQAAPETMRGRIIGLVTAIRTLGTLAGTLATPWLYAHSVPSTFWATSCVAFLGAAGLALGLFWERRSAPSSPRQPSQAA
ncbi:MAG: MFS transporter [Candidatus Sericytochromatia bacterium]|nr:MFS transporter [Candidatus Sericytochromatia bacterium]